MTQRVARFVAYWRSAGCLPDSQSGPVECHTRKELVEWIRTECESYGLTGRALRQVNLKTVWRRIQERGAESVCFVIEDTAPGSLYGLVFDGISAADARAMMTESEYD